MNDKIWQRDPNWIGAELDDSLVMLDVESGQYIGLNKTATAIWEKLAEPATASEIGAYLHTRFDVAADQCAAAVDRTLAHFEELGAIKPLAA